MFDPDQTAANAKAFLMARREVKRVVVAGHKFKTDQQRDLAVELELELQDMGFHMSLPPTHPQVIMAVAYSRSLNAERATKKADKDKGDEDHTLGYDSVFGGHDW